MELPDKSCRPRAFDRSRYRYQWRVGRIPTSIIQKRKRICPNPIKETAIFVVHGIGDQKDTDTAVSMRWGIEDALPLVELGNWDPRGDDQWILPAPYINDGHWAQYDDLTIFKEDIGDELNTLTQRQLEFFKNAWRSRTLGWFRSWFWIVQQGGKLIARCSWYKTPFFLLLTVLVGVIMFAAGVWPASRKFVVTYVNDARLYMEPRGDLEHENVQLIERRVARGYLKTIGLDMDLKELPDCQGILVAGESYRFKRVIWTAHSLGTVISLNVIGDILTRCLKLRTEYGEANNQEIWDKCPVAERVEKSLANFITFGSPIDKVCFLYGSTETVVDTNGEKTHTTNSVIRKWPHEYLPNGKLDITKNSRSGTWWTNVFYGSDPISGPLDTVEEFLGMQKRRMFSKNQTLVHNISTFGLRLPLASHTSYWKDLGLVSTILSATFAGFSKDARHGFFRKKYWNSNSIYFFRCWPEWMHGILSSFGLFWITVSLSLLIILGVMEWDKIQPWIKVLTGGEGE